MRPLFLTYEIDVSDPDGICATQTKAGAGALVIDGALASGGAVTLTHARHIALVCAGNEAAITFTVTGTDRFGNALSEDITGVNATSTKGTKNFKTVTGVSVSAALAGNVTLGTANSLETAWIPLSPRNETYSFGVNYSTGASMEAMIQTSTGNPWRQTDDEMNAYFEPSGLYAVSAVRLKINHHVTGTVYLDIMSHKR